MMQIFCI